ncbi:hypothetical protein [Flavobacterium sp.]|jgi:hypothetical protein|uniref:hypothetical protein n=1 Tax=Flavobacterium sp. TaxID=239 RepID=UPI0035B18B9E
MKQFIVYIGKVLLLVLLIMISLDFIYTYVFCNTSGRNKTELMLTTEDKNYDLIILGSSRAENHFVPSIFNSKGIKTFNYAMSGSKLEETALTLKLMLARNFKIKNLILDVDLNLNSDSHNDNIRATFLPYFPISSTIREHYKNIPEYNAYRYIPFYRYAINEAIGYREVGASLKGKKINTFDLSGFYPLPNRGKNLFYDMSEFSPKKSKSYEEIRKLCKENNINFIPISLPVCQNSMKQFGHYFDEMKKVYPEIHHYENAVVDDKYFSSCGHMNVEGAKKLSTLVLHDFFEK